MIILTRKILIFNVFWSFSDRYRRLQTQTDRILFFRKNILRKNKSVTIQRASPLKMLPFTRINLTQKVELSLFLQKVSVGISVLWIQI